MMLEKLNNELLEFLDDVEVIKTSNDELLVIYEEVLSIISIKDNMYHVYIETKEKDSYITKVLVENELSNDESEVRFFIYEANTLASAYKMISDLKDFKLESINNYNMNFTFKNLKVVAYTCYEELDVTITRLDTNEILEEDYIIYHKELEEVLYECLEKTM